MNIQTIRQALKTAGIRASVSACRQQYAAGQFNIRPVKSANYLWSGDETLIVARVLRELGFHIDDFEHFVVVYRGGFNFVRLSAVPV